MSSGSSIVRSYVNWNEAAFSMRQRAALNNHEEHAPQEKKISEFRVFRGFNLVNESSSWPVRWFGEFYFSTKNNIEFNPIVGADRCVCPPKRATTQGCPQGESLH